MSGLSLLLAILSLITALVPLADHSLQFIEHRRQPVAVTVNKPVLLPEPAPAVLPPPPPEVGQANVVFHNGTYWKQEGGVWYVWQNNLVAQGGVHNVRR